MHERVLNWRRDEDVNRPRAPHAPKSTPLINQPGACHHDRYTMTGSTLIRLKHHRQFKIKTSTKFTPSILNVEREIEGSMWGGGSSRIHQKVQFCMHRKYSAGGNTLYVATVTNTLKAHN
ncbi:hypothetical protein MTP99_000371 [Tenebrio molitor]|nr:hypothetical protein MTP99_000371 [Tenebrio molitor]